MEREIIFISKATPGDDEFVLWLAPRLEAAGYKVFADILSLEGGDRWRKEVTETLQNKAVKMLLCCQDSTLDKHGVLEEIGIAEDIAKELCDPRFIIPLRLKKYKKVFGIGELQYVDFLASWSYGLRELLETLENQKVPRSEDNFNINPNWENYKKRLAIKIEDKPEVLTTSWLRITDIPTCIRYYYPPGAINHSLMEHSCVNCRFPTEIYMRGFFSFASPEEIEMEFSSVGKFEVHSEHNILEFLNRGINTPHVHSRDAHNIISSMFRKSWDNFCHTRGLYKYLYSNQTGFHITKDQVPIGKRVSWGRKEEHRSSMLRNIANGKVWQYGVSVTPHIRPFPHFRLKARVLFAELSGKEAGSIISDVAKQHRLRRSICKGWRNKAWHGRLMGFLELLSNSSPSIELPLSDSFSFILQAKPILLMSPITTLLPNTMSDEAEELDSSTLGILYSEDDD